MVEKDMKLLSNEIVVWNEPAYGKNHQQGKLGE